MKITKDQLPANLLATYNKWVNITEIDNLDSFFENALLELNYNLEYKGYIIDSDGDIFITSIDDNDWLFIYNGNFAHRNFKAFEDKIDKLYDDINR